MNLVLWTKESSAAIPFSTLFVLLVLWFCVSVPLTFIGALFGFRKRVIFSIRYNLLFVYNEIKIYLFF